MHHCEAPAGQLSGEAVVLVHGLWMHGLVFAVQRHRLERLGYRVWSFSYPSVRGALADNARALAGFIGAIDAPVIHLVGHSLGGLVILRMLGGTADGRIGRTVLLGSPCGGSHCARVLLRIPIVRAIVGRSLRDWLLQPCLPLRRDVEVGVVAGDSGIGLGRLIPGLVRPNDGVVSVAETRLEGAADSIVLALGHSRMLVSSECLVQAAAFICSGRFER